MNLLVIRNIYNTTTTIGDMLINHKIFCHTLEDVARPRGAVKIPGKTAIPNGRYSIGVDFSSRFHRLTPHIYNVPNFEGIRMHGGNVAGDTEGCILAAYNIVNDLTIQGTAEAAITEMLLSSGTSHTIEIIDTFPYIGVNI